MFFSNFKSEINNINGVIQIEIGIPFGMKTVSVYLFKIDDSYVLFDAGYNMGNWSKLFFSALKDLNVSIKDIDYCFISHEHLDHHGLIKVIKRKNPNIKFLMHEITHEILKWETNKENLDLIEEDAKIQVNWMTRYGMDEKDKKELIEWFMMWPNFRTYIEPDVILHDGDEIPFKTSKLKVIWTPGHSLGHTCIFDENKRYLFAGDHILSRITPHIGQFSVIPEVEKKYKSHDFNNILSYYIESLDRIDNLNPEIIFPAHQKIIYNPHERIEEIKKHHEKRLKEVSDIIKNKPMTPMDISLIHFGNELDLMNRYLAVGEILGHLIYLENLDKVKRMEKNGNILFVS